MASELDLQRTKLLLQILHSFLHFQQVCIQVENGFLHELKTLRDILSLNRRLVHFADASFSWC